MSTGKTLGVETDVDALSAREETDPEWQPRKHGSLNGVHLEERLVPGLTFQVQKASEVMLDLNPNIAWRFTTWLTAGAGWNERVSLGKWNNILGTDRIYGPRAFTTFAAGHGFSLKAEVERMNVFIPAFYGTMDGARGWVWSAFAGFKKDYTFYRLIKGNIQVLYNLYDDHDHSPYVDRLNVRMGFELASRACLPARRGSR